MKKSNKGINMNDKPTLKVTFSYLQLSMILLTAFVLPLLIILVPIIQAVIMAYLMAGGR
jgi:hypothetical protein